jgi:hypothetical protein
LPKELRRLSMELARVDALLDDSVFFAPFERFFDPRRVGRPSTPRANRNLGESVITKRIDADRKLGLRGQLVAPQSMARAMARPLRAVTREHGGMAKWALD